MSEGWDLHRRGNLRRAQALYQKVLRHDPHNQDALFLLGEIKLGHGDHDGAIELFSAAIAQGNAQAAFHYSLARAHEARGEPEAAAEHYRKTTRLDPSHAMAHNNLGCLLRSDGRTAEALTCFRRALECDGHLAQAHFNLGSTLGEQGDLEGAVETYRRGLEASPGDARVFYALGETLMRLGRYSEALESIRRAAALEPKDVRVHTLLGKALAAMDRRDDARIVFRQALALDPDHGEALLEMGLLYLGEGDAEVAEVYLRRAVELFPDRVEPQIALGESLRKLGNLGEAETCYLHALNLAPDSAVAHNNLGAVLKEQGRLREATEEFERACRLDPSLPLAALNFGAALFESDNRIEALRWYRKALEADPQYVDAHLNLGYALENLGETGEALKCYESALAIDPEHVDLHWNQGLLNLKLGRYPEGWIDYEWRWKKQELKRPQELFPRPWWDGSQLEGQGILLFAEQGFGDAIQFVRYTAKVATEMGGRVVLDCQPELRALFQGAPGVVRVLQGDDEIPGYPVRFPLMSLPWLLKTEVATIPSAVPYLRAPRDRAAVWAERLKNEPGSLRVGLVWASNPKASYAKSKSVPLDLLGALGQIAGVRFYSLQKGPPEADRPPLEMLDFMNDVEDFADTAALIEQLDLVVAVDTAVAHLAGALGKPVWILLSHAADWRWLTDRMDSPWYPTMRLFRQPTASDWGSVVDGVALELRRFAGTRTAGAL